MSNGWNLSSRRRTSKSKLQPSVSTHVVYGGDKEQDSGGHMKKDDEEEDDQHGVCLRRPSADSKRVKCAFGFVFADGPGG